MQKNTLSLLAIGAIVCGAFGIYAATTIISGQVGPILGTGTFSPGGNAGRITLMNSSQVTTAGIPGVTLEGDNTSAFLKGNLFLQTVGYVSLEASTVNVIPPPGGSSNLTLPWEVTGNAWSENAGWIELDSKSPATYSGVHYLPITGSFTGLAWSSTLGYIDFSGNSSSGSELISRVKVIGNAGGNLNFNSLFVADNGTMKTTALLTPFINNVRKNVALLTRNAPATVINTATNTQNVLGNIMYYRINGGSVSLTTAATFCTLAGPRSLIVEGGDIVVDRDIVGSLKSCAIISLSDGTNGGHIYITNTPKNIMSYLVAEGSVFAGTGPANLYNDTKVKLANLGPSQLYILGGIISRNTIGGAITTTVTNGACPYTETTCNRDTAIKYDFNFFRDYIQSPANRAYTKNNSLENFSFIIENDARAAGDIPPGL